MNSTSEVVGDLLRRLQALEDRVDKLEGARSPDAPSPMDDPGTTGSVGYHGEVTIGEATYTYAWERPTDHLVEGSWDETMKHLAATAHPVRGRILQHLLRHSASVADLMEAGIVSSTGTAYHHLTALQSAGWIHKDDQGRHTIKPKRLVALLTLILAMEEA